MLTDFEKCQFNIFVINDGKFWCHFIHHFAGYFVFDFRENVFILYALSIQ